METVWVYSILKAILQGMTDAKPRVSYSSVCAFVSQVAEVKVTEVRQRLCKTVVQEIILKKLLN